MKLPIFTSALLVASPLGLLAQSERSVIGESALSGITQFSLAQIEAPAPPVPPQEPPATTPPPTATFDANGQPIPAQSNISGGVPAAVPINDATIAEFPTPMTAEQIAELTSEDLQDPFDTPAAAATAANLATAQTAIEKYKIAGIIHAGAKRMAAITTGQGAAGGRNNRGVIYLSLDEDNTVSLGGQPNLKVRVLEIKTSSITFEVDGTSEIVTLR